MRRLRIVIAEDETITALTVKGMLENLGHEVVGEGANGAEAIQLVREKKPDLVFLDIEMPRTDGIEAARVITREQPTPIIFLTAYSGERVAEQASQAGAVGYLVKPIKNRDLAPTIVMALDAFERLHPSGGRASEGGVAPDESGRAVTLRAYCLGQFSIYREAELVDEEKWASHKAGGRKAKAVLAYLLGHRQTGASREDMIDLFWADADYESAASSFNRTMHALRLALEPDLSTRERSAYIARQHGLYRLSPDLVWVDDDVFQDHLRKGHWLSRQGHLGVAEKELKKAVAVYQGDWLKGAPFADDWCLAGREERKAEYIKARYTLAEYAAQREAADEECQHYQRILEQDPYHEETYHKLIVAYLRRGRRHEAKQQLAIYKQKCYELNVEPAESILALDDSSRRRPEFPGVGP